MVKHPAEANSSPSGEKAKSTALSEIPSENGSIVPRNSPMIGSQSLMVALSAEANNSPLGEKVTATMLRSEWLGGLSSVCREDVQFSSTSGKPAIHLDFWLEKRFLITLASGLKTRAEL